MSLPGFMHTASSARLVAFYLPQFHPIPENDQWWGKGFTEWSSVANARPLFRGHYQPHLPTDSGFYDLRLPEARQAQADLAGKYGISGFCYYHYWFNGKRLLERPFDEVLSSGEPNFPFCLCWANESWSRRWLGEDRDVLQKQTYSEIDDLNHARWLINAFSDHRYIKVQNRPLFLVYRPLGLPDSRRTTDLLRRECLRAGLPEPYLLGVNAHCSETDCQALGYDGTLDFQPQLGVLPGVLSDHSEFAKLVRNLKHRVISKDLKIYDDAEARSLMNGRSKKFPVYPCIFVGWDNTPRRGRNGIIIVNSTPERFGNELSRMAIEAQRKPFDDRLVFINAWNEWAEGNHLEPDAKNGRSYLEVIRHLTSQKGVQG